MNIFEKTKFTLSICYIERFIKLGIPIYKTNSWLTEKREEEEVEEVHRQSQSITPFTQW